MTNLETYLAAKPYPGRGIMIGTSADGRSSYVAYFIMGRSSNSQNRIFVPSADGIKTEAFDPAKLEDPSLIIYHPVRRLPDGRTIVTNGDQTDTIRDFLENAQTFEEALATRTFEPDAPNWTPRISGLLHPEGTYELSILKTCDGDEETEERFFFNYDKPKAGTGHFISTYVGEGNPVPSFIGEPVHVEVPWESAAAMAEALWQSLNADNKVSLYAAEMSIATGETESMIINKNQ